MKKVIHVLPKFALEAWSGAEESVRAVAPYLRDEGFDSQVYTALAFSSNPVELIGDLPVRRFRGFYPPRRGAGWSTKHMAGIGAAPLVPGLLLSLVKERPDLVHLHCHNKLSSSVALVCRLARIPYVMTLHSLYRPRPGDWRPWTADNSMKHAAAMWTTSQDDLAKLRRSHPDVPSDYCQLGVDASNFQTDGGSREKVRERLGIPTTSPVFVHVARICALKNQLWSLQFLRAARIAGMDAHLVIAGPVSEEKYAQELRGKVTEWEISRYVHILPAVPPSGKELASLLSASDMSLLPSRHEAQGLVILEAWASGMATLVNGDTAAAALTGGPLCRVNLREPFDVIVERAIPYLRSSIDMPRARLAAEALSWSVTASQLRTRYARVCG